MPRTTPVYDLLQPTPLESVRVHANAARQAINDVSVSPWHYESAVDPGAVGVGRVWLDKSTSPWKVKQRNDANSGWETVLDSSATSSSFRLPWSPPTLVSPITIDMGPSGPYWRNMHDVSGATGRVDLAAGQDYILQFPTGQARPYSVRFNGGRHVVVIGGWSAPTSGVLTNIDWSCLFVENSTGTMFVEGFLVTNPYGFQFDAIKFNGGNPLGASAGVVIQNTHVEGLIGSEATNHSDSLQMQNARFTQIAYSTFESGYQTYLGEGQGAADFRGTTDIRHSNFRVRNLPGASQSWGLYLMKQSNYGDGFVHLNDVWLDREGFNDEEHWGVFPNDAEPAPWTASRTGNTISWLSAPNWNGVVTVGVPATPFATRESVGLGYVSPGYEYGPSLSEVANTLVTNAVTIATTATQIRPANTLRKRLHITNTGATTAYIGTTGVTTGTGQPVAAGASIATIEDTSAIYGIVASGTTTIRYAEESA